MSVAVKSCWGASPHNQVAIRVIVCVIELFAGRSRSILVGPLHSPASVILYRPVVIRTGLRGPVEGTIDISEDRKVS